MCTTEAERAVRVAREHAAGAPPYREQAKYGPLGDAAGNENFRADREAWYERFTARSIAEATLTERMSSAMRLRDGSVRTAMEDRFVR